MHLQTVLLTEQDLYRDNYDKYGKDERRRCEDHGDEGYPRQVQRRRLVDVRRGGQKLVYEVLTLSMIPLINIHNIVIHKENFVKKKY